MKAPKSDRPQMKPHTFILRDDEIRKRAISILQHMPIDRNRPIQVLFREEPKKRKSDQNALMFAGPLRDISEQAWLDGRQFSVEIWHEYFKRQLLPETYDAELCLESYSKWAIDPAGDRILVGSTTQLTVKGFAEYVEQVTAFGASLGVQFSAPPA